MAARRSPYLGSALLAPVPSAPPFALLSQPLQRLMRRALSAPPRRRPDAATWERALATFETNLQRCERVAGHRYGGHLPRCPWCERREALGRDPFPGHAPNAGVATAPPPTLPEAPAPLPRFRGTPRTLLRRLPAVTIASGGLGLAAGIASALWLRARSDGWGLTGPVEALVLLAALTLPAAALPTIVYLRTRASPLLFRALGRAERLMRAGLGATLAALALSLAIGAATGSGSILAGDWLLLPSLWLVAFALLHRWLRPQP
jgi:hypothetical protein